MPTTVDADGVGRYPPEVEAAVYFCCLEVLQNVAKYAGPCAVGSTEAVVQVATDVGDFLLPLPDREVVATARAVVDLPA